MLAFDVLPRAFRIMNRRVMVCSKVNAFRAGAEAKASLNRATQLQVIDAKPGDLPMARLK
jgi:hypothetical protein